MKIVISSCGRYREVRESVLESLKARLPGLQILCFTTQDDPSVSEPGVRLMKGPDRGWAHNTRTLLEHHRLDDDESVLLWMDDLLLLEAVARHDLDRLQHDFDNGDFLALALYQPVPARCISSAWASIGLYSKAGSRYPVSCMGSIVKVGFLKRLLRDGETAWDFEKRSRTRLQDGQAERCMLTNFNAVNLSNIVVRGKIVGWRAGGATFRTLPPLGQLAGMRYRARMLLHFLFMMSPAFFRRLIG